MARLLAVVVLAAPLVAGAGLGAVAADRPGFDGGEGAVLVLGRGNQGGGNQGNGKGGRDVPKPTGPSETRGVSEANGPVDKLCEWLDLPFCNKRS